MTGHTAGGVLYSFKLTDRDFELLADFGKGTDRQISHLTGRRGQSRQRDAAADAQAFHQHTPAAPRVFDAADDIIQRNKDILAIDRTIHKGRANRIVTRPDDHALVIGGNQRTSDAVVGLFSIPKQAFWIVHLKG